MDANQRKEIEERAKAARTDDDYGWLAGVDIPALLSALDAAEARAKEAEDALKEAVAEAGFMLNERGDKVLSARDCSCRKAEELPALAKYLKAQEKPI